MGEALLTTLTMDNCHLSTLLSMDSGSLSHDELEREMNRPFMLMGPPDINLPLSLEPSPLQNWNDPIDILDVNLGSQIYEAEATVNLPKAAKKCTKRLDSVWGAWLFFSFYFKPVLNEKSKSKIVRDSNGLSGYEKADLQLDSFLVQHDMENMYMWVFKERPDNALGKMQLRSFMNGHSRQGERPFPFSVDRGFVRSHRMQRKHYRGLSNPQCIHGIEVVRSPNLMALEEEERKRWAELTGRDVSFTILDDASSFGSWRNHHAELELDRLPPLKSNNYGNPKKLLNGTSLNLSTQSQSSDHGSGDGGLDLSPPPHKIKKDFFPNPHEDECCQTSAAAVHLDKSLELKFRPSVFPWLNDFTGVMKKTSGGPVTAAKSIYEDDEGFLVIVSLPFADFHRVKVTWRNTPSNGIVKITCVSTGCQQFIKRHDRTFKLTDPTPEHCPPGEFVREIPLPTRIPEDGKLEAYCDETGTVLEIMVPKHRKGPEEHEVRVCFVPPLGINEHSMLS